MQTPFTVPLALALTGCGISLSKTTVVPDDYLDGPSVSSAVYTGAGRTFHPIFAADHTEYGKLVLVGIDDHPTIKTVEFVVQDDGVGAFVVVYHQDGTVVSYPNPQLTVDRKYLLPNEDWSIGAEQDFTFSFKDDGTGFALSLELTLDSGEAIDIELSTRGTGSRFDFLAAIGADLSDVRRFPLIHLQEGGFVPREGTRVQIRIDGVDYEPTTVPIAVEGVKSLRTVYSFAPAAFFWNEEQTNTRVAPVEATGLTVQHGGLTWTLADNDGHVEIERVSYTARGHETALRFSPPLPDLAALSADQELTGRFCMGTDGNEHVVCGEYSVEISDTLRLQLSPTYCWQPMPGRDWVSAYQYRATFKVVDDGLMMSSVWTVDE